MAILSIFYILGDLFVPVFLVPISATDEELMELFNNAAKEEGRKIIAVGMPQKSGGGIDLQSRHIAVYTHYTRTEWRVSDAFILGGVHNELFEMHYATRAEILDGLQLKMQQAGFAVGRPAFIYEENEPCKRRKNEVEILHRQYQRLDNFFVGRVYGRERCLTTPGKFLFDIPIHRALLVGDIVQFCRLINGGEPVNARDHNGETALHWAIFLDDWGFMTILIDAKADVNAINNDGETPLHSAVDCGNMRFAKILIDSGADIHAKNFEGVMPLYLAKENNNKEMADFLIKHGAIEYPRKKDKTRRR